MKKLAPRSEALLRYMVNELPLGVTRTSDMPDGLNGCMSNVRGLQRAGLITEDNGVWFANKAGQEWVSRSEETMETTTPKFKKGWKVLSWSRMSVCCTHSKFRCNYPVEQWVMPQEGTPPLFVFSTYKAAMKFFASALGDKLVKCLYEEADVQLKAMYFSCRKDHIGNWQHDLVDNEPDERSGTEKIKSGTVFASKVKCLS